MNYKYNDLDNNAIDEEVDDFKRFFKNMNKVTPTDLINEVCNKTNPTCSVCKWTTVGCLNLGEPNKTEYWMCHRCVKNLLDNYNELLYSVIRKFPDESRHRTAKRYIKEAECNNHYEDIVKI